MARTYVHQRTVCDDCGRWEQEELDGPCPHYAADRIARYASLGATLATYQDRRDAVIRSQLDIERGTYPRSGENAYQSQLRAIRATLR